MIPRGGGWHISCHNRFGGMLPLIINSLIKIIDVLLYIIAFLLWIVVGHSSILNNLGPCMSWSSLLGEGWCPSCHDPFAGVGVAGAY